MDGGPFRGSRPADRGAARPQQQTHRQSEEPQAVAEQPKTVHRPAANHAYKEEKSLFKRLLWPIIIVVALIILGVGGWFAWSSTQNGAATSIDKSKYQAVFFTNGQVYFGKLEMAGGDYMKLTDIYYLQSQQSTDGEKDSQNPQDASTDQSNVRLIKLGDEIHGPEDEMTISKEQVLFFENLKADGKVTQSIGQYKQSN